MLLNTMNTKTKNTIGLFVVAVAIFGFFWLANLLGSGEKAESEKPLVICNPPDAAPEQQKCNWTAHVHATVMVFMKGEKISLGFEQGNLEGGHTHAEPSKIHWHGLIPVDPKTKEVIDWSALEVSNLALGPKEVNRKFIVNGKEVEPSYVWQDGDNIEIHYE